MKEYHKIDSVYKRDERGKFIVGEYSRPEFEYLADLPWLWTEKIDGTNIRIMYKGDDILEIGGRTDNAQIPTKLNSWIGNNIDPKIALFHDVFNRFPTTLYGEGYGAGIQKGGGLYSNEQKFILFDVKVGDWWLTRENVEDVATKLGIDVVPLFIPLGLPSDTATLNEMIVYVQTYANDPDDSIIGTAKAEGYVGTPAVPLFARNGDRIITKVKYRDFR